MTSSVEGINFYTYIVCQGALPHHKQAVSGQLDTPPKWVLLNASSKSGKDQERAQTYSPPLLYDLYSAPAIGGGGE